MEGLINSKISNIVDAQLELVLIKLEQKWTNYWTISDEIETIIGPNEENYAIQVEEHVDIVEKNKDGPFEWSVASNRMRRKWHQRKKGNKHWP